MLGTWTLWIETRHEPHALGNDFAFIGVAMGPNIEMEPCRTLTAIFRTCSQCCIICCSTLLQSLVRDMAVASNVMLRGPDHHLTIDLCWCGLKGIPNTTNRRICK